MPEKLRTDERYMHYYVQEFTRIKSKNLADSIGRNEDFLRKKGVMASLDWFVVEEFREIRSLEKSLVKDKKYFEKSALNRSGFDYTASIGDIEAVNDKRLGIIKDYFSNRHSDWSAANAICRLENE